MCQKKNYQQFIIKTMIHMLLYINRTFDWTTESDIVYSRHNVIMYIEIIYLFISARFFKKIDFSKFFKFTFFRTIIIN